MFRCSRPLFNAVARKSSTGITGLAVHPRPLPVLQETYQNTLQRLSAFPATSVYRQATEALTHHKLEILKAANGDVARVEKELDEGQIEESLVIAEDEWRLAGKMLEWKAWEPLEEAPEPGQWEYFGKTTTS
ncbi:NADH2 dehydrogenase [Cylindrobasidium torrendii FP15055 ss-10]|uniref:NADH2 dehydrogenase n=1 Tax=Cylindrobasidium torrendii FP15055 ss-10 TaxID=1314674 RepID=A0A0D7BM82_9AGAR|nr:NADH2 dehydrogenase [Cylindrobasidium torrendii FP15055 ss-10]